MNFDSVIFKQLPETDSGLVITDYNVVEFDPANFDNKVEGFAIGSFNSLLLNFKEHTDSYTESILDDYIEYVKENLFQDTIKSRDCTSIIKELRELKSEINNLITCSAIKTAVDHLESRLRILTAYAG